MIRHGRIGTIFEIAKACGGGGRYDKMIGKFTGNDVPACGFSIGFERIRMESGFKSANIGEKVTVMGWVQKSFPKKDTKNLRSFLTNRIR